jgi:uncharacterized protein
MAEIAPIPCGIPIMRMRWMDLMFAHWPVDPAILRPLVPEVFMIDTFDGRAWIGLVPFTMEDVSPSVLPRVPIRGVTDFHECNVRTYVRRGNERGVFFLSLDATSRMAVWGAKTLFHLPYKNAHIDLFRDGRQVAYEVKRCDLPRATMRCRWRVGSLREAARPGELSYFLTERYQLMTADEYGRPRRCRIWHEPWPLRDAELLELDDGLVAAAGLPVPDVKPLAFAVDSIDVSVWPLERMAWSDDVMT